MKQLEKELIELKKIMSQFSRDMGTLTESIGALTDLTSLILNGAVMDVVDIEEKGVTEDDLSVMWASRTGPN